MSQVIQLVVVSVFLVAYCNSAPWSDDNNFSENDLKWHCNQLCTSNNGEAKYDSETSTCYCKINSIKKSDTDWKCMANNARLLGITLEVYESDKSNKIKRDIAEASNTLAENSTKSTSITETPDANITTTDPTLQLPLSIHRIRSRIRLQALRPLRIRRPIILGAPNPDNEVNDKTPENLKDLRKRIHERLLELRLKNKVTTAKPT